MVGGGMQLSLEHTQMLKLNSIFILIALRVVFYQDIKFCIVSSPLRAGLDSLSVSE